MEIRTKKKHSYTNVKIPLAVLCTVLPMLGGGIFVYFFDPSTRNTNHSFVIISSFFSITAFSVLFRILQQKQSVSSNVGEMSASFASISEVVTWFFLAFYLVFESRQFKQYPVSTVLYVISYLIAMLFIVKPLLVRMGLIYVSKENLTKGAISLILIVLFFSVWIGEWLGVSSFFGAFFAGFVMPKEHPLKDLFQERFKDLVIHLFLPIFFVMAGLKLDFASILKTNSLTYWILFFGIFLLLKPVIAIFFSKNYVDSQRQSLSLGVLLGTRGFLLVIVSYICLEQKLISASYFSVFYLIALVSTAITSPLFDRWKELPLPLVDSEKNQKTKSILISFGMPEKGAILLRLANLLTSADKKTYKYFAMHFTPFSSASEKDIGVFEENSFAEVSKVSKEVSIPIEKIYKTTENITYEILDQVKQINSKLLLLGGARPLFSKDILGGKIRSVVSYCPCDLGILIEKESLDYRNLILIEEASKKGNLQKKFRSLSKSNVAKLDTFLIEDDSTEPTDFLTDEFLLKLTGYGLIVMEVDTWRNYFSEKGLPETVSLLLFQFR